MPKRGGGLAGIRNGRSREVGRVPGGAPRRLELAGADRSGDEAPDGRQFFAGAASVEVVEGRGWARRSEAQKNAQ